MFKLIKKIKMIRARKRILNNVTFKGEPYSFHVSSNVILVDNSDKKDIIIGDRVSIWGSLSSHNHGKIIMEDYSKIGANTRVSSVNKIVIGKYSTTAEGCIIIDNNNHPVNPEYRLAMRKTPHGSEMRNWKYSDSAPIIIGENVWLGRYVTVLKGVTIGDNAVIAANSVVTKDVPANSIAAGNPAKIVKKNIDKEPLSSLAQEALKNFYKEYSTTG
ncbi:acyltransferase [Zunongwangia sp.]|uniref:acyltransferase n=1 Tax=Zunongwangia sp. TaxID=1965325 RepID=UPI003AA9AA32